MKTVIVLHRARRLAKLFQRAFSNAKRLVTAARDTRDLLPGVWPSPMPQVVPVLVLVTHSEQPRRLLRLKAGHL